MRPRNFNILLAILLSTALMASFVTVAAKPVEEHPDWGNWPANTLWGAKLSLENSYADVYFGATTGGEHVYALPPAPTPPWIKLALEQSATDYGEITRTQDSAPQSYTYYVAFQATTAQTGLTLSAELDNSTHLFVPQDFSVIIENAAAAIGPWNMRVENGSISLTAWITKYATLYVDNAVNIESIDNLDPLSGTMGDTLRLNVFVKNTGIKTDTYNVSAGGSLDPVLGPIAPGVIDNVIVTTTLPGGTADIVITAAGAYATDQDSVSATGTTPIVLKAFDTAWAHCDGGIEPWVVYSLGDNPPVMVARDDIGSGGVAAAGFAGAFEKHGAWPWMGDNLDILLDNTFQYINPGAENVLWYGWNIYNDAAICATFIAALEALGYNVDGDDRPLENLYAGYTIPGYTIPPGTFLENLPAYEDSYVNQDNIYQHGDPTYGPTTTYNAVGNYAYNNQDNCRIHIKFDLTGLGATATSISSATLIVKTQKYSTWPIWVAPWEIEDDWSEENLCWDNMPTQYDNVAPPLEMDENYTWYSWDVTDYVKDEFTIDNIVSIKLKSENEGTDKHAMVYSDDHGSSYPRLEITYIGEETVVDPIVYDKGLENYDILVIPQLQLEDTSGKGLLGGDPWALSDEAVEIIENFVEIDGKGLFIAEAAAYTEGRYNYCRVQNRILHALNFGWWFQHDCVVDNVNTNFGLKKFTPEGYLDIAVDVEEAHPVGSAFIAAAGHDNARIYKACSLIPEPTITATINVPDEGGIEGSVVTVSIPITNTSGVWDNFELTATDTQGWCSTVNLSTTMIYLDAGANTTVTIDVTIPPMTAGTVDIITVTATSFSGFGSKLQLTGTGTVTSTSALATVEVDIIEPSGTAHCSVVDTLIDPCYRYDPLTFTVKVWNRGRLDDKYELTIVTDNIDLGLKLDPQELFVPAGDTEYAALSVTIPESWWADYTGTVTVVAVGMMSSENQIPLLPDDNDSVVVIAGENKSVEIEILPDSLEPQTGAPDSPLVWLVVIKNTGNTPETFSWSGPKEVLSGVSSNSAARDSWGATLDNPDPVMLDPSTKAINYLRVTVPGDAKTSEWNTITVDIETEGVYDEYTVMAHVLEPGPRIPEGVIEIAVEAEVIAIYVHPTQYDFDVMDEHKVKETGNEHFKVRNTGNVNENILVRGTDAQSMPGEPVTTWELDNLTTSIDQYRMAIVQTGDTWLNDENSILMWDDLEPGNEKLFGLKIQTPTAITTPARMWARVKFIAIASGTTDVGSTP